LPSYSSTPCFARFTPDSCLLTASQTLSSKAFEIFIATPLSAVLKRFPTFNYSSTLSTPKSQVSVPTTMKFTLNRPDFTKIFTLERKYTIAIGNDNDDNDTTTLKVPVFEDGPLEAALYWRKQFEELATLKGWNANSKFTNALLLLTGDAKDKWLDARDDILGGNNPTDVRFNNTMNAFISKCGATADAAEDLREFLMNAKKPANMTLQTFKRRITELNRYLPYLPGPLNQRLNDAMIFTTIKKCVPAWQQIYIQSNARAMIGTIDELIDYYEALEDQETKNRERRAQNNRQSTFRRENNRQNAVGNNEFDENNASNRQNNANQRQNHRISNQSTWCDYHHTNSHNNRDCRAQNRIRNAENRDNEPSNRSSNANEYQPRHRYNTRSQSRNNNNNNSSRHEENHHNQERDRDRNDNNSENSDDDNSRESMYATNENENENFHAINQKKEESYIPELIIGVLTNVNPPEYKYLRALVDSGASRSILHGESLPTEMQTIITDDEDGSITWETKGGTFKTKHTASVLFQLSELTQGQHFLHTFKIDNTTKNPTYDIILGRDLFQLLKLDLIWSSTVPSIAFENKQVEMKPHGFWTRTTIQEYSQSLTFSREKADEIAPQVIFHTSDAKKNFEKCVSPPHSTKKVESPHIILVHHEKSSLGTFQTSSHATERKVINKHLSNTKKSHGREFSTQRFHHHHQNNEESYFAQDDKHCNINALSKSTFRSANLKKNEAHKKQVKKFTSILIDNSFHQVNGTAAHAYCTNPTKRLTTHRLVPQFA
jgi:hypothetical protein